MIDRTINYRATESEILVYQYYDYADRIEVAPALRLSSIAAQTLWGSGAPVVTVQIHNLNAQPIIRLEIDGLAIAVGDNVWETDSAQNNCRSYSPPVINRLEAPLKVRWQFAEANPKWHEAMVTVPTLASLNTQPDWIEREKNIFIYFQKDGHLAAQLQQVIKLKNDKLGIRTTAIAPKLLEKLPCDPANDSWADEVVRIEN